jgi:hypothetical protein
MEARKSKEQMPPLATHYPDREAIVLLSRWIKDMALP